MPIHLPSPGLAHSPFANSDGTLSLYLKQTSLPNINSLLQISEEERSQYGMEMVTAIQQEWCAFENAHFHLSNVRQTADVRDATFGQEKRVSCQLHF